MEPPDFTLNEVSSPVNEVEHRQSKNFAAIMHCVVNEGIALTLLVRWDVVLLLCVSIAGPMYFTSRPVSTHRLEFIFHGTFTVITCWSRPVGACFVVLMTVGMVQNFEVAHCARWCQEVLLMHLAHSSTFLDTLGQRYLGSVRQVSDSYFPTVATVLGGECK